MLVCCSNGRESRRFADAGAAEQIRGRDEQRAAIPTAATAAATRPRCSTAASQRGPRRHRGRRRRTALPAAGGADLIKDTTTAGFAADVIRESRQQPVLVDFWAPWCGPCKQLTPALEKAVRAAGGKVKLVKMNIDDHPSIAGQLGIQSIPAVIAFKNGQPVDGFMGAHSRKPDQRIPGDG